MSSPLCECEHERDELAARVRELEARLSDPGCGEACPVAVKLRAERDQYRSDGVTEALRHRASVERLERERDEALTKLSVAQEQIRETERERDEARELLKEEAQWDAQMKAESDALAKGSDAWMKELLGPLWGRLWGPHLEAFGRGVDDLRKRAERAEADAARLREALKGLVGVTDVGDGNWLEYETALAAIAKAEGRS